MLISNAAPLKPQALFLDEQFPILGDNAGANAALDHMRALRCSGFEVRFAAAQDLGDRGGAAEMLRSRGIAALTSPWYGSVEEILRQQARRLHLVYLHRASVAAGYARLVRQYCPTALLVYSVADLHHLRLSRQAVVENRPLLKNKHGTRWSRTARRRSMPR